MNKKGFTTVELITSFTLATIVMLILFNVILILKDKLNDVNVKTNMLVEKDNLSYTINKRFKEKELASITLCDEGDKCYLFTYSDSTSDKLIYNAMDKTITFNNYTFDIIDGITVEEPVITEHYDISSITKYNGYFIINIPITLSNKDYSIKVIKHFNTDSLVIDFRESIYDNLGNKYIVVDYLESTGTQYIDTGVILPISIEIRTKYNNFESNNASVILPTLFGSQNGSYPWGATYIRAGGSGGANCLSNGFISNIIVDYEIHNYNLSCSNNYMEVHVDNNLIQSKNINANYNSFSIYLFAMNSGGIVDQIMSGKIYYAKLYSDVNIINLVRDYIPVIDSSDRSCLFDKVSKECYYNQGTGEFLWG